MNQKQQGFSIVSESLVFGSTDYMLQFRGFSLTMCYIVNDEKCATDMKEFEGYENVGDDF